MYNRQFEVPDEFPRVAVASSVGGFQNKLALTQYGECYYVPGNTPPERYQQWCECEKFIPYYVQKCIDARVSVPNVSDGYVLQSIFTEAVEVTQSLCFEQMKYLFGRAAGVLGWNLPELPDAVSTQIACTGPTFSELNKEPPGVTRPKTSIEMLFESIDSGDGKDVEN